MSKKPQHTLLTTHAKLSLSQWQVLADIIKQHSKRENPNETEVATEPSEEQTLSITQINDAVDGPFQAFFNDKISAYARLAQLQFACNLETDDLLKDNIHPNTKPQQFSSRELAQFDTEKIAALQKQLDALCTDHYTQWQQHAQEWIELTLQQLNRIKLELSTLETTELQAVEPISELLERYVALNLDKPKVKKADMSFRQYLTLKADLAIHSALARQHKPHQQKDIDQYLKQLQKTLNNIYKSEQQLRADQKQDVDETLSSLPVNKA